jgi:hypothetical protein
MCELCGTKQERKDMAAGLEYEASRLERLALHFRGLASGRILPHQGKEHELIRSSGRGAVRFLVDWFVREI